MGSVSPLGEKIKKVQNNVEKILNDIESNRFKSLDDPGIYGIKYRLSRLNFLKVEDCCCSGHPDQLNRFDDGYFIVEYKTDNNSKKFHNQIIKIDSESKDYKVRITSSEESLNRIEKGLPVHYDIEIERKERDREVGYMLESFELAEALKILWEKVSKVINEYEEVPISEQLEDWYFAFKSHYGVIENTHISFIEHKEEIIKRGGNYSEREEYE